jgi:hypothetical protein
MALGRLTNSLFSGTVDTNFSLATVNADFSLIRVSAPEAFEPLGRSLSMRRRLNAEEGPSHQAARRLGALFASLIPSTPNLVKAYGQRSSEIMGSPGVNPTPSHADGPFQDFVGADGTSIWAAATSGIASIGVLLLACMVARRFDDPKISTAIWVELVAERKKELIKAFHNQEIVTEASVIAGRQQITREDLAKFDASARAWLGSADQTQQSRQKKLMLILKNIPSPVSVGVSTYAKVINAWTSAMMGLENLLVGMPQEVQNSVIILALSAWHLYPNFIVLSTETKQVDFSDSLFPKAAAVTVGLHG